MSQTPGKKAKFSMEEKTENAAREKAGNSPDKEEQEHGHSKRFRAETPDNTLFKKLKGQAHSKKRLQGTTDTTVASPMPTIVNNATGLADAGWYPPDWNGADGGGRYIEVVNNKVMISTSALTTLSNNTTFALAGTGSGYVGDPEISYDNATKKFYYAMMDQNSSGNWSIDFGFSKTRAPNTTSDFCHYKYSYGTTTPDYPRLGGSKYFILIGTNNFDSSENYVGSSVQWSKKPSSANITTCPSRPTSGRKTGQSFTPVPAHQTDPSANGYIVTSTWSGGNTIGIQKVTRDATTLKPVFGTRVKVAVRPYAMPDDALQLGTSDALGTLDNRLFEAVQSYDPRLKANVVWTANTVFAGAGSGVQYYELTTAGAAAQQGVISSSSLYVYNGTVSPDRAYTSSTINGYGSNMGATFTTSSETAYPSMAVATKRGTMTPSAFLYTRTGTAPITCGDDYFICRWGDRSSANSAAGFGHYRNRRTHHLHQWLVRR